MSELVVNAPCCSGCGTLVADGCGCRGHQPVANAGGADDDLLIAPVANYEAASLQGRRQGAAATP
jgi:hypothetical protein